MKKFNADVFAMLVVAISLLPACTLVEYESHKVEPRPVTEAAPKDQALEKRVMELERKVGELEEKLKGNW